MLSTLREHENGQHVRSLGESRLTWGRFLSQGFFKQQRHTTAALLMKHNLQSLCYCVLTRVVETGQKEDKTLFLSWWVTVTKDLDNRSIGRKKSNHFCMAVGTLLTHS